MWHRSYNFCWPYVLWYDWLQMCHDDSKWKQINSSGLLIIKKKQNDNFPRKFFTGFFSLSEAAPPVQKLNQNHLHCCRQTNYFQSLASISFSRTINIDDLAKFMTMLLLQKNPHFVGLKYTTPNVFLLVRLSLERQ